MRRARDVDATSLHRRLHVGNAGFDDGERRLAGLRDAGRRCLAAGEQKKRDEGCGMLSWAESIVESAGVRRGLRGPRDKTVARGRQNARFCRTFPGARRRSSAVVAKTPPPFLLVRQCLFRSAWFDPFLRARNTFGLENHDEVSDAHQAHGTYRPQQIPQGLMDAMGEFVQQGFESGVLKDTAGLKPTSRGFQGPVERRQTADDGRSVRRDEGGRRRLRTRRGRVGREKAREVAQQFMELHRVHWPEFEGECEVRPLEDM